MKYYLKLILLLLATTIIFQGSQCASPQCASREMTTVKVAIQNGDVPKAMEYLQMEISKNHSNGEAYILLAELKNIQGDRHAAIDLMNQAEPLVAANPNLRDRPAHFKFEMFQQSVKDGEEAFNRYAQNQEARHLENAIRHYQTSVLIRPAFFEGYRMLGLCNELLDRQDESIAAYSRYLEILQAIGQP